MDTFIFQSKFPPSNLREQPSLAPTKGVIDLIETEGGQVQACYATSGRYNIVAIAELDNAQTAQKVALNLQRHLGLVTEWGHAIEAPKFETVWQSSMSSTAPSRRER